MNAFLKLIQNGETAAVAEALERDPALATFHDQQGVSALLWSVYLNQPLVRDGLRARLAALGHELDVFEAAALGDVAQLGRILERDPAAVLVVAGDGWTALHLAAAFGTPEAVVELLERGAAVDAVSHNAQRNQSLHAAVALGRNPETVQLLLERGADPNALQAGGFTALFSVAAAGRRDLAELLVRRGADASIQSEGGKTAATFARERGHEELAVWLEGLGDGRGSA